MATGPHSQDELTQADHITADARCPEGVLTRLLDGA